MAIKTGRVDGVAEVSIDQSECIACGLCVQVCKGAPLQITNGKVSIDQSRFFGCIGCGHCMSVCPKSCITVHGRDITQNDILPIPQIKDRANYEQLYSLLLARRSIRNFQDRSVEREIIEKIIAAVSTAPMGLPPSDVEILILRSKEKVQEFAGDVVKLIDRSKWMFSPLMRFLFRPIIGKEAVESFESFVYPAFYRIFGIETQEFGATYEAFLSFVHPEDRESVAQAVDEALNEKRPYSIDHRIVLPDGSERVVHEQAIVLFDDAGKAMRMFGTVQDITERKKAEEQIVFQASLLDQVRNQLHHMAMHDYLTNIPNRYSLEAKLKEAIEKAKYGEKSALLFLDLDNFKIVNDTLGHAAGDEFLILLANIFKNSLEKGQHLFRSGGDEFAVLLERTTEEGSGLVAEKLRKAVFEGEICLTMNQTCFNLTVSIGIVMVDGTLDTQKILAYADAALYRAKDGGRNRVVFMRPDENITVRLSEANELVGLIKNALKENRFTLYFQPVVNLRDKKITHHEALLRLKKENGEVIFPGQFIPIAESFGLMPQIDRWVVESALKAMCERSDLNLFINLSGLSLSDDSLLEFIENRILKSNLVHSRIGFEITETAAVRDLIRVERWISRIKKLGCNFALDDFGIGFSSFTYLRMLPVDYLKIDGSFVRNLNNDPSQRALVHAMNEVAHALGKRTVAEFVENESIIKILEDLGIDCGQGYYLGKPATEPAFYLAPDT